ncbi:hypothetical protein BKA70DRAFT_378658 [Coprinopsis sp. MPI-PUGE-AT-0042]|nr:hypothetical protein BKA70DRAFT_378658 [Coprinopsis sp. MPI-PUGE-AT-0042]
MLSLGPSRIARNQDSEHIVDERPLKRQKTLDDVEKPPRGRPSALKSTLGKSTTSRQSSTSKGPVVINLVSSDEDEEVEDDSSPPTTSRATQIAKKSTGGMKPRRTSPATGPETSGSSGGQSSDSPPTSRSTKLLARKSTGGRGPTRFQPMPEKSTSSGSGSDSDSSSSSGASIIPDTALIKRKSRPSTPPDPTRSISQGSKPRPTSTQDLPGPSSISAP